MSGARPHATVRWDLPAGWADADPPGDFVASASLADPTGGFGVNVQVIALPASGLDVQGIKTDIAEHLAGSLTDGRLLDLVDTELDERPAVRALSTFVGERGDELTVEQWIAVEQGVQIVVSATSPSLDYHWHAPAFGEIIESIEFDV